MTVTTITSTKGTEMDLTTAIRLAVADTRDANGTPGMPAADAVAEIRNDLSHQEIDDWELTDTQLVAAYHVVLDADDTDIATALTALNDLA